MCLAYGVLYGLSCLTKHWGNFYVLLLGRVLSGVSTSILHSGRGVPTLCNLPCIYSIYRACQPRGHALSVIQAFELYVCIYVCSIGVGRNMIYTQVYLFFSV